MAKRVTVQVELPLPVRDAVIAMAAERGVQPSRVVLDALRGYFGALLSVPNEATGVGQDA